MAVVSVAAIGAAFAGERVWTAALWIVLAGALWTAANRFHKAYDELDRKHQAPKHEGAKD